ncbi:MAG: lysylphosphatidylglycerol synthase domain-containing protein [Wenzhouxiangella sp.]
MSRRLLVTAISTAALLFLLYLTWVERDTLAAWVVGLHLGWFALCLLLLLASNCIGAALFSTIACPSAKGMQIRRTLAAAYLLGQVSKYLPGRIWGVMQQAIVMSGSITPGTLVLANLKWFALTVILTSGVGLTLLAGQRGNLWLAAAVAIASIIACSFIFRSKSFSHIWFKLAHRFGRMPNQSSRNIEAQKVGALENSFGIEVGFTTFFALFGIGWWLFFSEALSISPSHAIELTSILALSAVIGMLSLMPGGLGAREVSMILLGSMVVDDADALPALAVASRATIMVIDFLSSGLGAILLQRYRKDRPYE